LYNGWVPIILAMVISSSGGFIMSFAVQIYKDIAVFQPVVNGVGGNLVAIFASRLSTALHRTSTQGQHASWAPQKFYKYPFETFFGNQSEYIFSIFSNVSKFICSKFILIIQILNRILQSYWLPCRFQDIFCSISQ
jgi:hypothetical protein